MPRYVIPILIFGENYVANWAPRNKENFSKPKKEKKKTLFEL
jgi:hypothetical protein